MGTAPFFRDIRIGSHPFVLLYACFSGWLQTLEKVCDSKVRVPRPAWLALRKVDGGAGEPEGERGGAQERDRGGGAAAGVESLAAVHRAGQRRDETLGLIYLSRAS